MPEPGRPPLAVGTYGEISVWPAPGSTKAHPSYIAKARFRDTDGTTRSVTKRGQTKDAARRALRDTLTARARRVTATGRVADTMSIADLADQWLTHGHDRWATNTVYRYELAAEHVKGQIGRLSVREFNRRAVNTCIAALAEQYGPAAAKSAKSVLSGMARYAMMFDALDVNPVRDSIPISRPRRAAPRALTVAETEDLCDRLRSDEQAVYYDLPDFVEFMLATGARIGEVCAARRSVIDLTAGTWEVDATVVRVRGVGLVIQPRPKTAAGWRVLALPPVAVDIINRREGEDRLATVEGAIFGSSHSRTLRDPTNTPRRLRHVLDRLGYDWVHSHTFRKTVATRLEEAGMTARQVADHLGHANPSMTSDVYFGRQVTLAEAARILDR